MTQVLGSFSTERGMVLAIETCARRLIEGLPTVESIRAERLAAGLAVPVSDGLRAASL